MPESLNSLHYYVERVVNLLEARDEITEDIKLVYDEAKTAGFVAAQMRQIVREYRMDKDERDDLYAIMDSYRKALGLLADTPLGEAAMERISHKPRRRGAARTTAKPARHNDLVDAEDLAE